MMPWSRIASASDGRSGRPRMAPWTLGCSVFTRPSMISGKPVYDEISITGRPCSSRNRRVPPVETISKPSSTSPWAKEAKPVLSLTLISTRFVNAFMGTIRACGDCARDDSLTPPL